MFASTGKALSQLSVGALNYLLQPENKKVLQRVLFYCVLSEAVPASEIVADIQTNIEQFIV